MTCDIHGSRYRHRPLVVCGLELHHLNVRAWQRSLLTPDGAWKLGVTLPTPLPEKRNDPTYGWIWDDAHAMVPRTCHGNVHEGITCLVHNWRPGETVAATQARCRRFLDLDKQTWASAVGSLERWEGWGLSVRWLQDNRLWGEL